MQTIMFHHASFSFRAERYAYNFLAADTSLNNKKATQEDISRIIQSIRLRDEQMLRYESEIKKITEEYRRLREELLPVFRMSKERSQPLPSPYGPNSPDYYSHENNNNNNNNNNPAAASPILAPPPQGKQAGGLGRKGSQKKTFWTNQTPKNASPTHAPSSVPEGKMMPEHTGLDPSAAAMAASSHLTASITGGSAPSPNLAQNLPSPTSPNNYAAHQAPPRGYERNIPSTNQAYNYDDGYRTSNTSTLVDTSSFRSNTTPTPGNRSRTNTRDVDDSPAAGSSAPSVEIFKSFRVSMDDPCHKVLPAALKKYNISADWRQYALYIVYGDQERCLGLEEKPLILFKQLDKEGKKPMFMLRRHAPPSEGHSGPSGMMGFDGGLGAQRQQSSIQLPGGVI
jgi:protein STE50